MGMLKSMLKTLDMGEHQCNVGFVVLVYRYIQAKFSTEIKERDLPFNRTLGLS